MNIAVDIFYDFTFRARHSLPGRSAAAALEHWHSYSAKFWFSKLHDQDALALQIETRFANLHGSDLAASFDETTDEGIARAFLVLLLDLGCREVCITNDGRRGAVARLA